MIKPEEVGVGDGAEFGGDFEVDSCIKEPDAGIDEIALALEFAAAEVGEEAFALSKVDAEEFDLLALPEAELASGEVGIIENGIKAFGLLIIGIIIAGGPEG